MTTSQAAKIIGCSPQHVRTLIRQGKLRADRRASTHNQHGYCYTIRLRDAERYRDKPQTRGYPRGRKRKT